MATSVLVRLLFLSLSLFTAGSPVTGIVVDSSGRPVPRAVVQIVGSDGSTAATVLTESDGTFRVNDAPDGCRVQASLTGFQQAAAACSTSGLRLTLGVAPIADSIVVSATRTEAPSGQVASSVTVFDAQEIERRQQPLLAELLRAAPGTTVVRSGGLGTVTSLFVRAGESNYTKVLLDGIPLNEPGGVFNLSNVSTENLERVEFVRGANSALYGTDAMTGVIQLFTRRATQTRPEWRARAEGGSFSTARASSGVSGRNGPLDYAVDAAGTTTDNDAVNNRFRNGTLSGTASASPGAGATLRVIGRLERGTTGTPGQIGFGRPDRDAFFQRHDGVWGVTFDQTLGGLHQRAAYGLSISHQRSFSADTELPFVPSFEGRSAPFTFTDFDLDLRTDLRRHHASYQADGTIAAGAFGTHVETALVDWEGERADLRDALAQTSVPASRDNVGVTLQHQALWPRVFVNGSVRFEHNASFGNAAVPRIAAAWYLREGGGAIGALRVHGSAGKAIKEPTVLQSFSPNPFFLGNPDLEPERARTAEIGVEQRIAGDRARVDLTWFDNRYRNIIALGPPDAAFSSRYMNIGLTRARGAELTGDVALVHGLRARAGYTLTGSKILESTSTNAVFRVGNAALRRPRHSGFVSVGWFGRRASVDLNGSMVGRRVDSDFSALTPPILENAGYALWDLRASVSVSRAASLTFAVDNLFDRAYMEPLGYPALPRGLRTGVRLRF